jgi:hypothetical protein
MNEATKVLLGNAVRDWNKFLAERDRLTYVTREVASFAGKVLLEQLQYLKSLNVAVEAEDFSSLKLMGVPVYLTPSLEAVFPDVKASVVLRCGTVERSLTLSGSSAITLGTSTYTLDQIRKAIPESFMANIAEFVHDAFLDIVRGGTQAPIPDKQ